MGNESLNPIANFSRSDLMRSVLGSKPAVLFGYWFLKKRLEKSLSGKLGSALYQERVMMLGNLMDSIKKGYEDGRLDPKVVGRVLGIFLSGVMEIAEKRRERENELDAIPLFITISPTQVCNLHCKGCYAGSSSQTRAQLSYEVLDWVLREKKRLWGSFFTVISGGEPFAYRDNGKDIFDVFSSHPDQFFLVYTNGTLINKDVARKLAELGNATPAISVEGLKEETDARRGNGVFEKILRAMENLREQGVLFGISMTATRENADRLLSPEVIHFWMDEQKAFYAWLFQYMPIGRAPSLDLMVTPEQRIRLYERARELCFNERRFIVDFWNNGPVSRGCISAGRDYGYFYIDWNGNITPCVFNPYTSINVNQLYQSGKSMDDALQTPLFKEIRKWQKEYGYMRPLKEVKNWLTPCLIKDHHDCFCEIRSKTNAQPIDEWAELAMEDEEYQARLTECGKKVQELSKPLWEKYYLKTETDKNTV